MNELMNKLMNGWMNEQWKFLNETKGNFQMKFIFVLAYLHNHIEYNIE